MPMYPDDYKTLVLDEIKTYDGLAHPVRASFWERRLIATASPEKLHPNPKDEFSMENIGPNFDIISKYMAEINKAGANEALK